MDYSKSSIDIYDVNEDMEITTDLIISLGYNIDEVYYMCGNISFNFKGILG